MTLYLVPTYECNLDCKSCYSKKFVDTYPNYLTWSKFVAVYNTFAKCINNISFIGGEATKWKFINEAILFLENKKIKTTLFTNGTNMINSRPNNIIINANNLFNKQLSNTIIDNLKIYKRNKINVILRYNIDEGFIKNTNTAICYAKEYANAVSLSVLYPVNKKSNIIGSTMYGLAESIIQLNIKTKISRATPLCLFDDQQREYLKLNCQMKGTCSLPSKSMVINPDGYSVQPCVELSIAKKVEDFRGFSAKKCFEETIEEMKQRVSDDCINCNFALNGLCCGGCLAYK